MHKKLLLAAALCCCYTAAVWAHLPPGFVQYMVADSLNPTDIADAPDGRIFVTEKNGLVWIIQNGARLPDPFLILAVDDFNERGLGHIVLDPDFNNNQYVYLYYTAPGTNTNQVVRVTANGNFAVPGSLTVLYTTDAVVGSVHNGGDMAFGPDGKLYFTIGEGGQASKAQAMDSDLGKAMRINPDGSIPDDNPFYNLASGKYRAIYATGLRNPFSMSIQPGAGRIFTCDVGSNYWEEINEILPGKNYGWPIVEGKLNGQIPPPNYQDPVLAYDHNTGCSVVGAAFYNPQTPGFPADYVGKFYFADYCKGYIGRLDPATGVWETNFITDISRPVCILTTANGDFYYIARAGLGGGSEQDNTASNNGSIWRVVYTGSNAPFVYGQPAEAFVSQHENAEFQVYSLGEAPLDYRWQKNGTDIPGAETAILTLNNVSLADSGSLYRCIVMNNFGADTSHAAVLRVTSNTRPVPHIDVPAPDYRYRANDEIPFAGGAADTENGVLPAARLTWKIEFFHDEHTHPAMTPVSGIDQGDYFVSPVGETDDNVWYRLYLTARDSGGLSSTVTRDIFPWKSPMTVHTEPEGMEVHAEGFVGTSPYQFLSVVGIERSIVVPRTVARNDSVFVFRAWHDGSTNPEYHTVAPDTLPIELTARYDTAVYADGFGLLGQYFYDKNFNNLFDEPVIIERIDSNINFDWTDGSPMIQVVPNDNFLVRWSGQIIPLFSDTLTFWANTDDGAKLWINDSVVIDSWKNQPLTDNNGIIYLEAGKRYPIVLEYIEESGNAVAQLSWGSKRLVRSIVPQTQLLPPAKYIPNTLSGFVWLDANADGLYQSDESGLAGAAVLLFPVDNPVAAFAAVITDSSGRYNVPYVLSGKYYGLVLPPPVLSGAQPGFGLDANNRSVEMEFPGGLEKQADFSFIPDDNIAGDPYGVDAWRLYPNPVREQLTVFNAFGFFAANQVLQVVDMNGKVCLEHTLPEGGWITSLRVAGLAPGVYVARAGQKAQRFVVTR